MKSTRLACDDGRVKDVPANRRGVVLPVLHASIPIQNNIIPLLHCLIGTHNDSFEYGLLKYIDERHEMISPDEEREARLKVWTWTLKARAKEEEVEGLVLGIDNEIAECKTNKQMLAAMKKQKVGKQFRHSLEERRSIADEVDNITEWENELKQRRKQQKDSLKYTITELKAAEEDLANIRLLRSKVDSPVRQSVDQILKENEIDRAATHDGQFTGTHWFFIEKRVDPIIDKLEKVLLANPEKVESDSATKEAF
jgi:hypothetical protein